MMQKMGMQMEEIKGVTRVIIQRQGKDIVIEQPMVTSINVQGQKMYQIAGGKVTERTPQETISTAPTVEEKKSIQIPEEDVLLVAQTANVSIEKARETLMRCEGDLARAILMLQTG
jgi:nascent polypeptide-associated complex subunit alpha